VDRTDRGTWDGTWYYSNRDSRIVLWLRSDNGAPEARLRYLGTTIPPEAFATDWDGEASYAIEKGDGNFHFTLIERDADTIRGNWDWILEAGRSARAERGEFTMYRGGDGRMLVMAFENFERVHRRGDRFERYPSEHVMTFRKISKRLVLWDEIPF